MPEDEPQDMLGSAQWDWLEEELRTHTADVTLLGSGLQVISSLIKGIVLWLL